MLRRIGFTLAITGILAVALIDALAELALTCRPRLERWQARRHAGTGLYPAGWHR